MSVPTFTLEPGAPATSKRMNPTVAAMRIGVARRAVDKLTATGVLPSPLTEAAVNNLAVRPLLQVTSGELTVLRTDSSKPAADEPDRDLIGFDLSHDDPTLEETSLRWWRSEPDRVLANRLFAVTVGTVPVAVYEILTHLDTVHSGERQLRHRYGGTLLARLVPKDSSTGTALLDASADAPFRTVTPMHDLQEHPLLDRAAQIMRSRIVVDSGGPVGYLEPTQSN